MGVYKKLAEARVKLQSSGLKKSGKNKFSNYDYFELEDFLPEINKINSEIGLCSIVSFGTDLAVLQIIDVDKSEEIISITSPMAQAELKGCHAIQNLGAVESYQRRYLYMAAYEIAENDMLDATTGKEKSSGNKPSKEPSGQKENNQGTNTIDEAKVTTIRAVAIKKGKSEDYICKFRNCTKFEELTLEGFTSAMEWLKKQPNKEGL